MLLIFPPRKEQLFIVDYGIEKITADNMTQAFSCLVMNHTQHHDAQRCVDTNVAVEMSLWISGLELQGH